MTTHSTGWIPQRPDHRDRSFGMEERILAGHHLPAQWDLWPKVPPIWDQLTIGSCTAHGSLRAFMTEALRQGETVPMLSRLMQYFDARAREGTTGSDVGASVRDAIKALAGAGCAPEDEWPYDVSKLAVRPPAQCYTDAQKYMTVRYQAIQPDGPGAPMRTAVFNGLAIVFGFSVPEMFEDGSWDPATQILPVPGPNARFIGGHCVAITGYDFTCRSLPRPYFTCDNSWGHSWGGRWGGLNCAGGRFAIDAAWFSTGLATDLWVIQGVK